MKINFPDCYRSIYTLDDIAACKAIQKSLETSMDAGKRFNLDDDARTAAYIGSDNQTGAVLRYDVEFAKNNRIEYNFYADGSEFMDVWLTVYAYNNYCGLYVVGAYLSDIWQAGSDNRDEIKARMYIRHFTEDK